MRNRFYKLAHTLIGRRALPRITNSISIDRAKRPKHPTNKAFDKLGVYSKSPKVADAMIEA